MNDKQISKNSHVDSSYEIVMIYSETLVAVKADLAEKPGTEGSTTPKSKIKDFFWTLYEKTLKVIVDAIMERFWPK